MGVFRRRRAALQAHVDAFGFGRRRRTYAVTGVMGGLAQLARRTLLGLAVLLIGLMIALRPPSAFLKGAVVVGAVLVGFGLRLAWRRFAAAQEINRCYLYPDGVVVTSLFGQVRDVVAWADVTTLGRQSTNSPLMAFHRIELGRRDAGPLVVLALGSDPALAKDLVQQAAQHDIRPLGFRG
ncbi:hypothetical protein ABZ490_18040 [Streptomyces sp. NPDC005811]|uniref:hypothetical protein n=1 Tax=Streptomyces sp. NPDC005811 TaxID=3154565 RepID=UPI003402C000